MLYLITDDHYFSMGVLAFYQSHGIHITSLTEREIYKTVFAREDCIFLAVDNYSLLRKLLPIITRHKSRLISFANMPKKFTHMDILSWSIYPKRISFLGLRYLYASKCVEEKLPIEYKEFHVLHSLYCGKSPHTIASEMGLHQKTVSAYKRRAMARLGVKDTNSLVFMQLMSIIVNALELCREDYKSKAGVTV